MTDGDGRTITVTIAIPPKYAVLQVIDFIKGQNEHHRAVASRKPVSLLNWWLRMI